MRCDWLRRKLALRQTRRSGDEPTLLVSIALFSLRLRLRMLAGVGREAAADVIRLPKEAVIVAADIPFVARPGIVVVALGRHLRASRSRRQRSPAHLER